MREWIAVLSANIEAAIAAGELRAEVEPLALAFRLNALGMAANWQRQLLDDPSGIGHARAGWGAELDGRARPQKPVAVPAWGWLDSRLTAVPPIVPRASPPSHQPAAGKPGADRPPAGHIAGSPGRRYDPYPRAARQTAGLRRLEGALSLPSAQRTGRARRRS